MRYLRNMSEVSLKGRCRNSDVEERCGLKEDEVTRAERGPQNLDIGKKLVLFLRNRAPAAVAGERTAGRRVDNANTRTITVGIITVRAQYVCGSARGGCAPAEPSIRVQVKAFRRLTPGPAGSALCR
ncbi:hypothetical protein EVAR_18231_1 [Eumeta japonica]|uniref:Uncharacterized protein n=1 Tax=Eumeta variegata TaxID=151549 RepID=A0A4C1UL36_EUMVA|nr:hypothetical protein EVAR_18231_1 [Eumeta japonica]